MDNYLKKRNFGPVKDATVELKPFLVFIGAQGTGKSTIAKLLSIFQDKLWYMSIDFKNKININCHIVVAETFPRNNAAEITKAIDFAYNTLVPLIFDNEIELLSNMD